MRRQFTWAVVLASLAGIITYFINPMLGAPPGVLFIITFVILAAALLMNKLLEPPALTTDHVTTYSRWRDYTLTLDHGRANLAAVIVFAVGILLVSAPNLVPWMGAPALLLPGAYFINRAKAVPIA